MLIDTRFLSSYYVIYTEFGFHAFDFDSYNEYRPYSNLSLRFYDLGKNPDTNTCTVTTNPDLRNVE